MERNFDTNDKNWETIKYKLQEYCKGHTIEVNQNINQAGQDIYWNKFQQITGKSKTEIKDELNRFVNY